MPATISNTPPKDRLPMIVDVYTVSGRHFEYDAMFGHTFDAYDDAITRFPDAARVEVEARRDVIEARRKQRAAA